MVYSRVILRFLPEFSPLIKHGNRQRKPFSFISFTMEKKNNSKSIGDFCSALNCTKCRNKGNQGIVFLAIPMEGSRKVIIIDNISLELRKLLCYDADLTGLLHAFLSKSKPILTTLFQIKNFNSLERNRPLPLQRGI